MHLAKNKNQKIVAVDTDRNQHFTLIFLFVDIKKSCNWRI